MDLFLQIWGAVFYLSNKVFFALSVGREALLKQWLQMAAWIVYLLGVPAWVAVLLGHNNWIAASIEAGGVPAMLLGLYNAFKGAVQTHKTLNALVSLCTYASLGFGLFYSLNHHGGIVSLSQVLEMGVMIGFLMGSYLLAKHRDQGWLFFMLMNVSMAALMILQDKPILMGQQLASLCFVVYGYTKTRHEPHALSDH